MSPGLPPIPGNGLRGDMVFPVDLPEAGSGVRGRERGSIGDSIDRMGASRPEIFFSVFVGFSGGIITSQLVVSVWDKWNGNTVLALSGRKMSCFKKID